MTDTGTERRNSSKENRIQTKYISRSRSVVRTVIQIKSNKSVRMNQLRERIKMRIGMKMRWEKKSKGKKKVNNSFSVDEGRAFLGTISNNNNQAKWDITSQSLIKIELGITWNKS